MFKKMRNIVVCSKYLPLSFDEVTMKNNQLWVSIHCYVTKVIMDILKNHASVFNTDVVKICHLVLTI